MINSESDYASIHSENYLNFFQTLNNPQQGKQYLTTALESQNEENFMVALHNLMDAILWELENNDCSNL